MMMINNGNAPYANNNVPIHMQQQEPNNRVPSHQQMMQLNSNTAEDYRDISAGEAIHPGQMSQASQLPHPVANTRLKVDITNSSYGATNNNSEQQRRQLNSGGAMSVHTPMSQVSGYSNHLAPQNSRFQQQPPTIITNGVQHPNMAINSNAVAMQGSSAGMASMHSGAPGG